MKWIFGIVGIGALVMGYLYFLAEPPVVKEVDPEKPWAAESVGEPAPANALPPDPRKLDDIFLQKDYCGARDYFNEGRNRDKFPAFLKQLFESEAGKAIPADDKLILDALFDRDLASAISKLKKGRTWQAKLVLGLMYSGLLDSSHHLNGKRIPRTDDQLRESLVAFDEAEDLNGENGFIPLYRYLVMSARDGKGPGLNQFLNDEISKRRRMESPFRESNIAFARLRAQDPLFFAATLWPEMMVLPGTLLEGTAALKEVADTDAEARKHALRLSEGWHRDSARLVNEGFSDPIVSRWEASESLSIAQKMWKAEYPRQALPDRLRETPEAILNRMEDRNPRETMAQGWLLRKPCGPKWKEAVDNDTELLRDRLRKYDDLERSRR